MTVVQEEITEFIDDQLVVLQDVGRAFLVVERDPPRLWFIPWAYLSAIYDALSMSQ